MCYHGRMGSRTATMTSVVRKASRDVACGKGKPGRFNPNRSVRFASKNTDRRAARGRTARNYD